MYGISTIKTVISGRKNILVQMFSGWRRVWQSSQGGGGKYSANVQWLEEGVAVKPGWRGEVQSLREMCVGVGGRVQ